MITPIELHNRQHKAGRGYKKKEMDLFLEEVFENYEQLYKENVELKDKISRLSDGVQQYKTMETALQKALVLAEKTSKDTIESASQKAALLEKEAKLKADTIVNNALSKSEEIKKQCILLLKQYNQFKAQYKQIALKQIELLDGDFYEIYSKDLIDAVNEASKGGDNIVSENENTDKHVGHIIADDIENAEKKPSETENESEQKITEDEETAENNNTKNTEIINDKISENYKADNNAKTKAKAEADKFETEKRTEHIDSHSQSSKKNSDEQASDTKNANERKISEAAHDVNGTETPLNKHIKRAIKIGSDMTEFKDSPNKKVISQVNFTVKNNGEVDFSDDSVSDDFNVDDILNGDTKEFTPFETEAIDRAAKDIDRKNEINEEENSDKKENSNETEEITDEDNDENLNRSIRKLRSQLAKDRKSSTTSSSFEFFDNE